jgi:hypothetical protein
VLAVRRHDAAHRLLLHVLELRQQHRLRLIFESTSDSDCEGPGDSGPSLYVGWNGHVRVLRLASPRAEMSAQVASSSRNPS